MKPPITIMHNTKRMIEETASTNMRNRYVEQEIIHAVISRVNSSIFYKEDVCQQSSDDRGLYVTYIRKMRKLMQL